MHNSTPLIRQGFIADHYHTPIAGLIDQQQQLQEHISSMYAVARTAVSNVRRLEKRRVIQMVDDDLSGCQPMREQLESTGSCRVLNTSSQRLLLGIEGSTKADLIILNCHTVIELVRKLRIHPSTMTIPIIIMVEPMTPDTDLKEFLYSGAVDTIRKPISKLELCSRVIATLQVADLLKQAQHNINELVASLKSKQRETFLYLELLIQSRHTTNRYIEGITRLSSCANGEVKARLSALSKQFQREIKEEARLDFEKRFDEVNHDFYQKLFKVCPGITRSEKKLCAYLRMGHSPAEIGRIMDKTLNCINVAFARIRAKLGKASNCEVRDLVARLDELCNRIQIAN